MGRKLYAVWICAAALMPAGFASADSLSEEWSNQLVYWTDYTNRACRGERAALELIQDAALDDQQAVPMHELAWLNIGFDGCDAVPISRDSELARILLRDSAGQYYPPAMYDYGRTVFYGYLGEPQRLGDGLSWLESAAMEGMASAAEELALIYAEGRGGVAADFGPVDYYYTLAERNGLPADRLRALADALDLAAEGDATGPRDAAGGATPNTTQPLSGMPPVRGADVYLLSYETRRLEDYPLGQPVQIGAVTTTTLFYAQSFINDESNGCYYPSTFVIVEAREQDARYSWDPSSAFASSRQRLQNESTFGIGFTLETFPEVWNAIQTREACFSCGDWVMSVSEADARFGGICPQTSMPVVHPEPVWVE